VILLGGWPTSDATKPMRRGSGAGRGGHQIIGHLFATSMSLTWPIRKLPASDAECLRSFIIRLSDCQTTGERDQVLAEVMEEVTELLSRRPGFQRHWLLKLDQISKRFTLQ
jgi:hypothetical protein